MSARTEATAAGPLHGLGPVVLASGSLHRARLLTEAGIEVDVDPPQVDERLFDGRLDELGPDGLAVELALRKLNDVAPRHPGRTVIAADQVGILRDHTGRATLLTKQPDAARAVAQLMAMSATTHHLVNGVAVRGAAGSVHTGVDVQTVTMRRYELAEARAYVTRFAPYDTSGSYRLEDQDVLEAHQPGSGLVAGISGEHPSGVIGLPMPLLTRLLVDASGPAPGSTAEP
ncbi:MAG: Maf family protein [Actinobacteria bacterium]|nr:Maf family protein [Actinomycetota bacterium]